jgi:transposase InsO family protein
MRKKDLWYGTLFFNIKNMERIDRLLRVQKSEAATFRVRVLAYHSNYGTKATLDAYGVSRATLFRWKKVLRENYGKTVSLVPASTRPKNVRQMMVDPRVIAFIKEQRERYPIGKEKLKSLLDVYCLTLRIPAPSESQIGKIIKRYHILPRGSTRMYHDPNSGWAKRKRDYRSKVKSSPRGATPGYLEIDTICEFNNGIRRYILNAIDVNLRFEFSYPYTNLSSRSARDFMTKLEQVYPLPGRIHTIQTDNGLEFRGEFEQYLKEKSLTHLFIYPRCPKINGFVERSNRTLKEEFLNYNQGMLFGNMASFKKGLVEYLIWYNTKRPHKSLGNMSPIDYLLKNGLESQMCVTSTKH